MTDHADRLRKIRVLLPGLVGVDSLPEDDAALLAGAEAVERMERERDVSRLTSGTEYVERPNDERDELAKEMYYATHTLAKHLPWEQQNQYFTDFYRKCADIAARRILGRKS